MTQLELVDVVTLHSYGDGTIAWGSAPARHAANLQDYGSLIYHVDDSTLFAVATTEKIDGRSDPHARRLREDRRRNTIPQKDLEDGWGLTPADAEDQRVAVYAADAVIALRRVEALDTVDVPEDVLEESPTA